MGEKVCVSECVGVSVCECVCGSVCACESAGERECVCVSVRECNRVRVRRRESVSNISSIHGYLYSRCDCVGARVGENVCARE